MFRARSRTVDCIRRFFIDRGFLEVETPMMHSIPGGAVARPFVTHHNALDTDLYLRIAPELYLKRLVVGGFERVFEINRNFRNEGVSTQHNPEFTMLEFYQAYADYVEMMDLTEDLVRGAAHRSVRSSARIEYQGEAIDLVSPFRRMSMADAILATQPGARSGRPRSRRSRPRARRVAGHRRRAPPRARQAVAGDLREDGRGHPAPADVHHRAPDGGLAALAREATRIRSSPTVSSCSSPARRSPTASPS